MLPKQVRRRLFRLPGLTDLGVRDKRLLTRSCTPLTYWPGAVLVDSTVADLRVRIVLDGIVELRRDDERLGQVGKGTMLGLARTDTNNDVDAVALSQVRTVLVATPVLQVIAQRSGSLAYWLERDRELAQRIAARREA